MKRVFWSVLIVFIVGSTGILAQEQESRFHRNELNVEVNDALPISIVFGFREATSSLFSENFSSQKKLDGTSSSIPFLSFSYNFYAQRWLGIGLDFGYYKSSRENTYIHKKTDEISIVNREESLFSTSLNMKFIYINLPKFQFYGRMLAGVMFYNSEGERRVDNILVSENDYKATYFMGQMMPVGLRFGNQFAGFVEFGFGVKGFFGAGLSVKF